MKLEVRRRDSLPTISGLVTQNIQRPKRTVGVQTSGGPGEPDIVRPYLYFIVVKFKDKIFLKNYIQYMLF